MSYSGLFRDNLQHWLGDFARLLKVQFTRNDKMSNDPSPPIHECMGADRMLLTLPEFHTVFQSNPIVWEYPCKSRTCRQTKFSRMKLTFFLSDQALT